MSTPKLGSVDLQPHSLPGWTPNTRSDGVGKRAWLWTLLISSLLWPTLRDGHELNNLLDQVYLWRLV